jgi:hypothetical protein
MSLSAFVLSPPGTAQNTITRFVQSSLPDDIEAGIEAVVAEIVALNQTIQSAGDKYGLAAIDLAGGGDGFRFVVQLTFTTNTANFAYIAVFGVQTPSDFLSGFHAGAYLASDAFELVRAEDATYARLRAFDQANHQFTVMGNSFAGASQGTRFMGVVVGFEGTP